jgi:uncharacterized protein (TIGR03083 family)
VLSAENLDSIESEGLKILDLARRDREAPVPQYPGWNLTDLVTHTASIHGRTTLICRTLPEERIAAPQLPDDTDSLIWFEQTLVDMLTALREADPSTPAWTLTEDGTLAFWERRMVIETGIHRWDAQQAFETPLPLLDRVAVSGLDEFSAMWLPRLGPMSSLELTATDLGRSWLLEGFPPEDTASGTASDLYLRLMARPGAPLPASWEAAVDALATPAG